MGHIFRGWVRPRHEELNSLKLLVGTRMSRQSNSRKNLVGHVAEAKLLAVCADFDEAYDKGPDEVWHRKRQFNF